MSIEELFVEAERQLVICNSCRYCEGYCAVFPALERRQVLTEGDLVQIANVCHDCRACFQACMYTAPHEFEINPPAALAALRLANYESYVWPSPLPRLLTGWIGVASSAIGAIALTLLATIFFGHPSKLWVSPEQTYSPYDLLPMVPTLVLVGAPALFSVVIMLVACYRFWNTIDGRISRLLNLPAILRALKDAATMRNLRGGGDDCYYPDAQTPSAIRRHLHALTMYGFVLCLVATTSAAIQEHFLHGEPPYPLLSVPVLTGTLGGIGLVIGCSGLIILKSRATTELSNSAMTIKDYGLLVALDMLAVSGLLTLLARESAPFSIVYLLHLAAIVLAFAAVPYSKFMHIPFRLLSLVRDSMETHKESINSKA